MPPPAREDEAGGGRRSPERVAAPEQALRESRRSADEAQAELRSIADELERQQDDPGPRRLAARLFSGTRPRASAGAQWADVHVLRQLAQPAATAAGERVLLAYLMSIDPSWRDDRFRRLARGWAQLSDERRRRVLEFAEDQRLLSLRERYEPAAPRRPAPGRRRPAASDADARELASRRA